MRGLRLRLSLKLALLVVLAVVLSAAAAWLGRSSSGAPC
jgi:hypothetical protein